jgi:osmoprotectant transport system substrate-binding protein
MSRITQHHIELRRIGQRGTWSRHAAVLAAAVSAGLALSACGSSSSNPLSGSNATTGGGSAITSVVIGSANFPEDELLGEIYAEALEAKGIKVTRKFNISSREVYYPQISKGALTIIPEYNGALLTTSVDKTSRAASTADVDAALTAKLPASLEILNPSAAQDKDSVTVTAATASRYHLSSISDLSKYAKNWVIGGPPEFATRSAGLLGLESVYGLHFKSFQALDEAGPVTFTALQSGRVQAADVFTTTPQIDTDHFVVLGDPKNLFAAQNVIPLVYKKGVNSTIVNALNAVSATLTTDALLQMDKALSVQHASYSTVASGYLKSVNLAS